MGILIGFVGAIALSAFVESLRNAKKIKEIKEVLKVRYEIDIDSFLDSYLHKHGEAE